MNRNRFENIALSYLKEQDQLIDNDPYEDIKDNYESLKTMGEVD